MRLIRVAHIDIDLHWTFLIMLVFLLLAGGIDYFALIIVLFTSVVLHELSHSLVARMYGIRVKRIILLPIGGMSVIEEFAMSPEAELRVAAAGPLFSFALAAASFGVAALASNFDFLSPLTALASYAVEVNIILGAFNLLPALPLDGGRVWRALRQRRRDYLTSTREAVSLSKFVVIAMFVISLTAALISDAWSFLFWNTIIALFVFVGSDMELDAAVFKTASDGLFVRDAMRREMALASGEETLLDAFNLAMASRATSLILTGKGHFAVVSLSSLGRIPRSLWGKRRLKSLRSAAIHLSPETTAIEAWKRMRNAGVELAPVLARGKLVGAVHEMDIERLIYLKKVALVS